MQKGLIKLAYRQVIDAGNKGNFERSVLSISYDEFFMKSQAYNKEQKFKTFKEMVANDGRANSLHYKSGFAIGNLIQQLNKKIPELQNALGKSLDFEMHEFEVIDSDITNPGAHKVAITYITGILTFFGNIGEYMLLAEGDKLNQTSTEAVETFLLKVQHGLSVISYQ
ncbi:MAG TPA: hypothetical protein VN958_06045 [Chitinophagaceae bacterium]|nr:hypothetical protein [Chitinophagaceae bacterium]